MERRDNWIYQPARGHLRAAEILRSVKEDDPAVSVVGMTLYLVSIEQYLNLVTKLWGVRDGAPKGRGKSHSISNKFNKIIWNEDFGQNIKHEWHALVRGIQLQNQGWRASDWLDVEDTIQRLGSKYVKLRNFNFSSWSVRDQQCLASLAVALDSVVCSKGGFYPLVRGPPTHQRMRGLWPAPSDRRRPDRSDLDPDLSGEVGLPAMPPPRAQPEPQFELAA